MQWIGQQAQMGQANRELALKKQQMEFLTADNATNTAVIMKGVLQGDKKALMMAKQTGLLQMTPLDQIIMAGESAGIPEQVVIGRYLRGVLGDDKILADQSKMAMDLAPRFNGDVRKAYEYVKSLYDGSQPSTLPGRTVDENIAVVKQANELRQRYPTLPENVAMIMAEAQASGNREAIKALSPILANMPSKDMIDMANSQWGILDKQSQIKHRGVQEQLGWASNRIANANLALRAQANHLSLLGLMNNASNQAADNYLRIAGSKDANDEQKKAALEAAAASISAMPPIPTGFKDKEGNQVMFHPGKVEVKQVEKWFQFMRDDEYYLGLMDEKADNSKKPNKAGDPLEEFLRIWVPQTPQMTAVPSMIPGQ
jgi:hypothetical protein